MAKGVRAPAEFRLGIEEKKESPTVTLDVFDPEDELCGFVVELPLSEAIELRDRLSSAIEAIGD